MMHHREPNSTIFVTAAVASAFWRCVPL
jgi:UDPglucose 6-dehydrogenase